MNSPPNVAQPTEEIVAAVAKNSHETFALTKRGDIMSLSLITADGRGGFKPTRSRLTFHERHIDKVRALLSPGVRP